MAFYDEITDNDATEETSPVEPTDPSDPPVEPTPEESVKTEPEDEQPAVAPTEESAPESKDAEPLPSEKAPRTAGRLVSAGNGKRAYKTGTKIAAFIFFLITAGIFALYEFFAFTFLYLPLMESIDNLGEAIAAIFGYIFGLIYTLIFAIAQIPANLISIILFKRLRGKSDKKWENVLFTVFFALSLVMLLITVISTALFFVTSAVGG